MGIELLALAFVVYGFLTHQEPDRVVLLPDADGKAGAVIVKAKGAEQTLATPFASADVSARGALATGESNAAAVNLRYGATLAAQPSRPVAYTVYFTAGTDELTTDSQPLLEQVKREAAGRPAPEIVVIGHTDRVGTLEDNDILSKKRAETVREQLIGAGIPARQIESAGRGEREPLVPTEDSIVEPKNRRVEISIR